MKKALTAVLLAAALAAPASADEFTDNPAGVAPVSLDALAEDLGAALGGGSFHTGKALGFPLGFDLGVHVPVVRLHQDNAILKDNGSTIAPVWVQAELGLPGKINVIARGGRLFDADLYGGGARWGLFTSDVPGLPSVSIAALYSRLDHGSFDAETISGNVALSFDVPFIRPYVGAGYDRTKLEASGTPDTDADGYRVEAGVNLSLIPFTYVTLGVGLANDRRLLHAGAGVTF